MANKMLIDATHPEETRVVVVSGQRVEEFDFESEARKQLRGNIYLAKITRVEPSLQAAFVEYGGNRHGFLAFSEIHPDYYQIPVADREALLKHQAAAARREAEEEDHDGEGEQPAAEQGEAVAAEANNSETRTVDEHHDDAPHGDEESANAPIERGEMETVHSDETIESIGAGDVLEEAQEEAQPRKQRHNFRNYKIQEVVKRRQIMLVQVVKEERGNKGAALTTFLSLAGRYCVLMPNTARGGGISRKITQAADRKKLKSIAESLDVPEGMGLIVRTAGAKRTKAEIKRDYEYLLRMWESVRELTLRSTAPALVYEEGSLIKRSIRDLYDKDIDAVFVEGDEGYKEAKNFMRMLMPSHAKNVQQYKEKIPLFQKYQVEQQLDSMFNPVVTLKSGGYVVINPTEALVSIDVNSGRSTKERNIEQTALRTNLEAAEEIARQMRLRDLAGLIVIDFIDMDENRNNRAVERKLKDCLKTDRARIQVGRISHFGLLEMSRQRMRSGVLEGSTVQCQHCLGTGLVRSVESMALHVLRGVEAEAAKGRAAAFTLKVPVEVAVYILNQKRANLLDIEERYGTSVYVEADASLKGSDHRVEHAEARALTRTRPAIGAINIETAYTEEPEPVIEEPVVEEDEEEEEEASAQPRERRGEEGDEEGPRRKRRRRRRRGGGRRDEEGTEAQAGQPAQGEARAEGEAPEGEEGDEDEDQAEETAGAEAGDEAGEAERQRKRRRRGRRGGRRNRGREEGGAEGAAESAEASEASEPAEEAPILLSYSRDDIVREEAAHVATEEVEQAVAAADPVPMEIARAEEAQPATEKMEAATPVEYAEAPIVEEIPVVEEAAVIEEAQPVVETSAPAAETKKAPEPEKPQGPARRGWWQRRSSAD
ncbi:Rne/Rng family ribonuclease [Parvibaculum sedimenti]|uniref:Ribonuclease E n=1 Tax=Parvibaculum sedimenti TaxID=2608632 RepID=A0A6N6VNY2_9HYPH|nr:ribonuclease E/G [Parvibaculum sedimenti]KAB7740526.1 Rne/Rng family ribonuclease [Parvibaculum sedimenti]